MTLSSLSRSALVGLTVLLVLTLTTPALAAAGDEPISITAATRAAAVQIPLLQLGPQPRQRSMSRTWGGVGMIGAGVVVAFYSQSCRTTGSLAPDIVDYYGFGIQSTVAGSGLVPLVTDGTCGIDFAMRGTVTQYGLTYLNISERYSEDPSTEAANLLRGTAAGKSYYPKGRMYAGLGIAAAGVLLATVWSDLPVVNSLTVAPLLGGARVSASLGF